MVQSKSSRHEGDGDRVDANINPTLVSNPEVEVETEPQKQAPCRECALSSSEGWVVEGWPGVVHDEALDPTTEFTTLTDDFATKSNQPCAGGDEDGVAERLKVESVLCLTEGGVGSFKREEPAP